MSMYDAEGYLRRAQNPEKATDERVRDLSKCLEELIKVVKDLEKKTRAVSPATGQ